MEHGGRGIMKPSNYHKFYVHNRVDGIVDNGIDKLGQGRLFGHKNISFNVKTTSKKKTILSFWAKSE